MVRHGFNHQPLAQIIFDGRSLALTPNGSVHFGRDPQADLAIDHPQVSRHHASLTALPDGRIMLRDLGSTNGTYFAGARVDELQVRSSGDVMLGRNGPVVAIRIESGSTLGGSPVPGGTVVASSAPSFAITIGRESDNTLALDDPLVSRHHAELRPAPGGFVVHDLGSRNGTMLNGQVAPAGAYFREGDRLTIGRTTLVIRAGNVVVLEDTHDTTLTASGLSFALRNGRTLLHEVSFAVERGELVAVVGPSGAGKSTLLRAITGSQPATSGSVRFEGLDLYQNFDSLRQVIGVVPQDDVVHRQLTVRAALDYAAELRLPADYTKPARDAEVDRVVNDLELTDHASTVIGRLSGGQRKRTSVALELLTQPQLLLLDEPTSGLDPSLDRNVMKLLRDQADGGRSVLVVTHSTENLELCDKVLVLAPGGLVAYYGSPSHLLTYFKAQRYADMFASLTRSPDDYGRAWLSLELARPKPATGPAGQAQLSKPPRQQRSRQLSTLIRRHFTIILADRTYALSTLLMPLVIAAMALAIPGHTGFGPPSVEEPGEPNQLLVILTVGAAFMGMSTSVRELVSERAIFLREKSVGLSPLIYLIGKVLVFLVITALQSALLILLIRLFKPGADTGALLPYADVELWLAAFGTSFASAALGLAVSAVVTTGEQVMPGLVISIMAQLVFCGGLISITGRTPLEWVAAVFPSRWGFAQAVSTLDLVSIAPRTPDDPLWAKDPGTWLAAGGALVGVSLIYLTVALVRLYRTPSST